QYIFDTGISPEIFSVLGFVRGPHLPATVLGTELRRSFAPHRIESAGNLPLPATRQVQRVDHPHSLSGLRLNLDFTCISILPVPEGRCDYYALPLFLTVAGADLFADVLRIVIVHQATDTNNQV